MEAARQLGSYMAKHNEMADSLSHSLSVCVCVCVCLSLSLSLSTHICIHPCIHVVCRTLEALVPSCQRLGTRLFFRRTYKHPLTLACTHSEDPKLASVSAFKHSCVNSKDL